MTRKLKVYAWQGFRSIPGQPHRTGTREIVAALSQKAAAHAVGEPNPGRLFNLSDTTKPEEVAVAMAEPGVLFWREEFGKAEWQREVCEAYVPAEQPGHDIVRGDVFYRVDGYTDDEARLGRWTVKQCGAVDAILTRPESSWNRTLRVPVAHLLERYHRSELEARRYHVERLRERLSDARETVVELSGHLAAAEAKVKELED